MIGSILDSVRGLMDKLGNDPAPATPDIKSSTVQRVMRRPAPDGQRRPAPAITPVAKPDRPEPQAENLPRRVISRGNNKNVYVVAEPDLDEDAALRAADVLEIDTGTLETVDEEGFDPYNSGGFHRSKTWTDRR